MRLPVRTSPPPGLHGRRRPILSLDRGASFLSVERLVRRGLPICRRHLPFSSPWCISLKSSVLKNERGRKP